MPNFTPDSHQSQPQKKTRTPTGHDLGLDIDLGVAVTPPILIRAETATVAFVRAEQKKFWGREKFVLWFAVHDPVEYLGSELFMICPLAEDGKFRLGSKMTSAWTLANGKPPDRFDRMTMRVFANKVFVAKLKTITKNKNGPKPPHAYYTMIDDLLSLG